VNKRFKIIIIGYGRHGKDTVCDILKEKYNYNFMSSSEFCAEIVVYPKLKDIYNYNSVKECYEDRHNHRKEWFDLIISYNNTDLSKLGKEIFSQYDIYCGLRRKEELISLKENNVCDYIFWVDASKRLPPEDNSSCTVTPEMADYIIDNNSDLDNLYKNVEYVMKQICY
jgi:dephospho-CoA kinase